MPTHKPLLIFRNVKSGLQGDARKAMQAIQDICVEIKASDISPQQWRQFVKALQHLPAATTEMQKPRNGAYGVGLHSACHWR